MSYHRWLTKWPPVTVGRAWLELSHRTPFWQFWWAKLAPVKFGKINVSKKRLLLSYWHMSYVYGKWFLSKDLPEKKQFPQKNQYFFKIGMFFFVGGRCHFKHVAWKRWPSWADFVPLKPNVSFGAPRTYEQSWCLSSLEVSRRVTCHKMSSLMVESQIPQVWRRWTKAK